MRHQAALLAVGGAKTDKNASLLLASKRTGLSVLRHAYHLALKNTPPKVRAVPNFPMLVEKNVRTGFLRDQDYARLASECSKVGFWLRSMLAVACGFAWRRGEVQPMRVKQVDLIDRVVRLEPGTTKNGRGREVPMTQEIFTLLSACVVGKKPEDHVFTRNKKPVKSFRTIWESCCIRAGVEGQHGVSRYVCVNCGETMTKRKCDHCGSRKRKYDGLLFHDLRRTGCRNLRRAGVPESVAMKFSGHLTASTFRRYDIIEQADMRDAVARLDARQGSQTLPEFGQSLVRAAQKTGQTDQIGIPAEQPVTLPN